MAIAGSNTLEPQQSLTGTTSVQVQITDPDGVKGTGDESAVASPPILVPIAPTVWTPTGGEIQFTQSALQITTSHFFGVALADLDCVPGSTPDRTSLVPATPVPFETIMPPALPTCADTSVISGPGLTVEVDAAALCVDANNDLDPASLSIVSGPTAGTASTSPLGILTYTNSDGGVGSDQVVLTITDASGLVSQPFTVSIVVQSLRYIEQIGPLVALSPVTLDGGSAVATGDLNSITVTNVPVSGLGFTVSGYATDLAAPEVPTMAVDTNGDGVSDLVVPDCAGERRCIPASNLGWAPSAEVVIDGVDGGGAAVLPGPTDAASAQDWLSQLGAETPGPGLSQPEILCSSQPGVAHGTFRCDAGLFLGVPASAAEASYTGLIVITII
jgi:hypothetical protein